MSTALAPEPCPWCAGLHPGRICALVRAIEFHENGMMKRVEFRDQPQPITPFQSGLSIATPGGSFDG